MQQDRRVDNKKVLDVLMVALRNFLIFKLINYILRSQESLQSISTLSISMERARLPQLKVKTWIRMTNVIVQDSTLSVS